MIQPADPAHAAALALIHAASFPPGARWGEQAMALQLGLPGAFGFLDERGGMVLARVAADESEILTLAVMPAARRTGLGRALLQTAMRTASARGAETMVLEVADANTAALRLYESLGFQRIGLRRGYYRPGADALVLRGTL